MKYKITIHDKLTLHYEPGFWSLPVEVTATRTEEVERTVARVATKAEAEAMIAGLEARDGVPETDIQYCDRTRKPTSIRKWWLP
jgi:hypothetical protein